MKGLKLISQAKNKGAKEHDEICVDNPSANDDEQQSGAIKSAPNKTDSSGEKSILEPRIHFLSSLDCLMTGTNWCQHENPLFWCLQNEKSCGSELHQEEIVSLSLLGMKGGAGSGGAWHSFSSGEEEGAEVEEGRGFAKLD